MVVVYDSNCLYPVYRLLLFCWLDFAGLLATPGCFYLLLLISFSLHRLQCGNAISARLAVAGSVTMDLAQAGNLRMKDLLFVNDFAFRRQLIRKTKSMSFKSFIEELA